MLYFYEMDQSTGKRLESHYSQFYGIFVSFEIVYLHRLTEGYDKIQKNIEHRSVQVKGFFVYTVLLT